MHVASHVGRYMRMSALVENLANPIQPDCSGISIPREQFLSAFPSTWSRGTGPQDLLSELLRRLSPITKKCPSGTTCGSRDSDEG